MSKARKCDAAGTKWQDDLADKLSISSDMANQKLYATMQTEMDIINAHPECKNLSSMNPLQIGKGGSQAPYDADEYKDAMKTRKRYRCAGNMFWVNMHRTASPGIPLATSRIQMATSYFFETDDAECDVVIAVPSEEYDPMSHRGALISCSPEEFKFGLISTFSAAVKKKDLARIKAWKNVALTCQFEFRILITQDDIYFAAVNQREAVVQKCSSLQRTAFQVVMQLILFKEWKETEKGKQLSQADLAKLYMHRAKLSDETEHVTGDTISAAMMIHKHAFSIPRVVDCVMGLEEHCKGRGPFDKMTKLHAIVRKSTDRQKIVWMFDTIHDKIITGALLLASIIIIVVVVSVARRAWAGLGHLRHRGVAQRG